MIEFLSIAFGPRAEIPEDIRRMCADFRRALYCFVFAVGALIGALWFT